MGVLVYILPILIAIGLGLAQFDAGKQQIANLLELALGPGSEVELGNFSGSPADLRLDDLVIRDAEGVWLDLDHFRFRWAPSALLRGRLVIEEVSAASLTLNRLPEAKGQPAPEEPKKPFEIPGLPGTLRGLAIEQISVGRLALGKSVLGEAAIFTVDGRLRARDPQQQFELALRLDRQDKPTAHLAATAKLEPAETGPPRLTLDLEAKETGGLFAALADLPAGTDLSVDLKGTAPVTDWRGRLTGAAGGFGALNAGLELQAAADLSTFTAAAQGKLEVSERLLPEAAAPLLKPAVDFAVRLRRPEAEGPLIVDRLAVTTDTAEAEASGRLDLAGRTMDGRFDLRLPQLAAFEGLAQHPLAGSLTASGRLAGPMDRPEGTIDFTAGDLRTSGVAAERFAGSLRLAGLDGPAPGLRLDGEGRIEDLAVEGAPQQRPEDFDWTLGLDLPADGSIGLRKLALTGEAGALTAAGRLQGEDFALDASLDVAALQRFTTAALAGLPTAPRLRLRAEGQLGEPLTARVTGRLDRLTPLPPAVGALSGEEVTFAGDVVLTGGTMLTLSDLSVSGQAAEATGEAAIDLARQDLQARFGLAVPRLSVLSPVAVPDLAGVLRLTGEAGGPIANPRVKAEAVADDLVLSGQAFDRASAEFHLRGVAAAPAGAVALTLARASGRLAARTDFLLQGRRLTLSKLDLDPGADLAGTVTLDLDRLLADGKLRAESGDLAPLARFFGLDWSGAVALDLEFDPGSGQQRVVAGLDGSDLAGPFGSIGRFEANADLRDVFADPRGEARFTTAELRSGATRIDRLSGRLEGGLDRIAFSAEAAGRAREEFDLQTAGGFAPAPGGGALTLDRLDGRYAGEPLRLREAATIRLSDTGASIDRLSLAFAGAEMEAAGGYGPSKVDLTARVTDLPLRLSKRFGGPPLDGRSSARLTVTGAPQDPQAEMALEAKGLKITDADLGEAPPVDAVLNASLRDRKLHLELRTTRLFAEPVVAQATLPLQLSLQPFTVAMPPDGAVDGRLKAEAELPRIASLLLLDDQRLGGRLDVDLLLSGTVAQPRAGGNVRVADGAYQNLVTGTVLSDIQASFVANGTEIAIERFTATDGGEGKLKASGAIDLAPRETFPFAFDLSLDDAVLVRHEDVVAAADGKLDFTGRLGGDALLSGKVTIGPAQLRIPDRLPPSVVDLNVIEIGPKGRVIARPERGRSLLASDAINLDLNVRAERIFVRGRGLESEWDGKLRIDGTAAAPEINGQLQVRRGFIDFLDRRLDVTRGVISFPGARPPSPNIDVVATSDVGDGVTAELALHGDATKPELTVRSQPELPQDEVLARLLFGRDLSRITPIQAVKLAAAANRLRGGGGLDLLGETRNLLGLDVLDIRTQEQEDTAQTATGNGTATGTAAGTGPTTTIGVGKYITDNIFVEVERGLAGDSGSVSVEIELTPNVTVDTNVGADAQTGVGLKWRYDY